MDSQSQTGLTRRQLLGGVAAASLGATSGCVQRVRSIMNRQSPETVSLTVTAPPADSDRIATLIARHLVTNLEAAGIDATLDVLPESELRRQVLLNRNFELFVARLSPARTPQEYKSHVYSTFAGEPGLQNPYGYANLTTDSHLERQQQQMGTQRQSAVKDLITQVTANQPFTTVGFPDEIRAVRTEKFTGWGTEGLREPLSYLALERTARSRTEEELELHLGVTDGRFTQNLNPLAVEYRQTEPFTSLLYDPLARSLDNRMVPWLAEDWSFISDSEGLELEVVLRPGLVWHDGTPITADDVAFSYRFLTDTSLDTLDHAVPAPRFRGRTSLMDTVQVLDDRTVRFSILNGSAEVADALLTVPLFPEHEWRETTDVADISGFGGSENVTEALVTSNSDPVGSGPLQLEDISTDEQATFVSFEDHFTNQDTGQLSEVPDRFVGDVPFEELVLDVVPSNETAIELLSQGDLDGTATSVDPREQIIQRIGDAENISMLVEKSPIPYQIGYNTSVQPFSNPYFRRLIARLVDKEHIATTIFEGYGSPASTPIDGTRWAPAELTFDSTDPIVPFMGSDGEIDVAAVQEAFRERGYEFNDDGTLILR